MNFLRTLFSRFKDSFRFKKSTTVKTMFSFMSVALLLGAAIISGTDVSYVKLQTPKTVVEAGERFSIDVFAYAHVPVNAVDVTLQFEEAALKAIAVDRGQSVLTIWTEDPIIEKNKVILRGGTFRKGFIGEHKIATIELEAKESGQSELFASDIILLAGDGKGTPVKVAKSNTSTVDLYVYDENTDPTNIAVKASVAIITDVDGDGQVGLRDISSFMGAWGNKTQIYDFNGDGRMSFKDFSIILADAFLGT
jgi:hypothetical protein